MTLAMLSSVATWAPFRIVASSTLAWWAQCGQTTTVPPLRRTGRTTGRASRRCHPSEAAKSVVPVGQASALEVEEDGHRGPVLLQGVGYLERHEARVEIIGEVQQVHDDLLALRGGRGGLGARHDTRQADRDAGNEAIRENVVIVEFSRSQPALQFLKMLDGRFRGRTKISIDAKIG